MLLVSKSSGSRTKPAPADAAARFVGDRLRQLRETAGLSQEGLAARSKLSAKFVGEVERAATNVSIGVLWKLVVDGLGGTDGYLLRRRRHEHRR